MDKVRQKILIVDDEQDICRLLEFIFSKKGYEVCYVHTLNDGFATLNTVAPAIIFLDLNLPDGSGLDALSTIKTSHPQSIIISISALDAKQKALANGASYFIGKPFTINEINSIVNSIVH